MRLLPIGMSVTMVRMMHAVGAGEASRHKCLVYDGDLSEQLPVVVPLLLDGLRDNWRCLYLGSPEAVRMVESALEQRGIDVGRETERGALVFSSDRSHLENGKFEPSAMIDGLRASVDDALHGGFQGLCATGDMRWELGDDSNFDRLVEYEARLDQMIRELPLRGICQYHRALVPTRAIADALVTHRSTFVGVRLNNDNLFYVPPEFLLATDHDTRARHGEWMYQQIARVLDAERARDQALSAAQQSEAEQRRLAEQLAVLNRELEERVAERTAELRIANKNLEAFSYSVAHDLRAPLRAIRSFSAIIESEAGDSLDADNRRHLQRVTSAAEHMSLLIDGLLDLSRVGREDLARTSVDLGALARGIVDELRAREPARHVEIAIAGPLVVNADARLMRALFENLLSNAWKFTAQAESPRIEIGSQASGGGREIFVRDNGVGFESKFAETVFEPFRRLHGAAFQGTGIGLATVQRIIERHRGRIRAEAIVGGGATFYFTLPD